MTTLTQLSTKAPTLCDRPEVELLLCCARTHIEPKTAARIRTLLEQDIDWAYLIQTAGSHGVIPLLYQSLSTTSPEAVPKAILSQLRNYFHTNAQRNLFMTGELLKLLNLFEQHEIRVIPFKGPVLAASAYGNLALRQFGDLDILVHEQDMWKAKDLLISQGYQQPRYLTDVQEEDYLLFESCDYSFVHNDKRVVVELHWKFTSRRFPFNLDIERLWERLEPVSLAGTAVLNLSPEDLLLYLSVHGCKHLWQRLLWLCDIAELLRVHPELEWKRVMEQARMLGSERMLLLSLLLAHQLLGILLPEEILQRMQAAPVVNSLAAQVQEKLLRKVDDSLLCVPHPLQIRMRERLQEKVPQCFFFLRFALGFAITPNEHDRALLRLPASLSFLYYLVRPLRLAGKYGLSPLRRFMERTRSELAH
jgi:hypothetical protein